MTAKFTVRRAEPGDAQGMARVHVDTWRETYRGSMRDAVLDDPGLLTGRENFWSAALTDARYERNTAAVAVSTDDGALVGIALSGPALDDSDYPRLLYVLYAYQAFHGSGVGAALLDAVLDRSTPATLWVADPNPRAQAFYLKQGFGADGEVRTEDDVREVRMVRPADASGVH